ncbi:MAG: effector binding domain-containing protein [Candidatus Spyradocola sp.]|jgi:DNA-binding transcriptional MerR regulator
MSSTISEVSRAFSVSTRTLRYYEEMGLIRSHRREDYAYRVYDEADVRRLEQIVFLRSLRVPLKSIAVLLDSRDAAQAVEALRRRIQEMEGEMRSLRAARDALRRLESMVLEQGENWPEGLAALLPASPPEKTEEERPMTEIPKLHDVRILTLPRMTVAAAHALCAQPEAAAGEMMADFVRESDLARRKPDARLFGFNHPNPSEDRPVYGYEFQVTIPDDMEVPPPLVRKVMPGGLYAAHAIMMGDFHEWGYLLHWVQESDRYEARWAAEGDEVMGGLLEEHLNYLTNWPENESERQLDLLFPIRSRTEGNA